ncbi:ArdC-like ssDNA-binding domain-containing protein [Parabacteroides provencensis]|uniref:ArdC-like ssDNA-binding domain-containing protein n=1 Tax=Parabacteroides provencensis TaxID=1944636 RepID=UPI000C14F481|nr:ArdC-like ssDNA-binding domain-containing protein [Parabacteroides provencensis]
MKSNLNKQIDVRRAALIELSVKARAYREEQLSKAETEQQLLYWSSIRINDIIAEWYRQESGATEFKTFAQWKASGYNIKKGSKAFILWSKKKNVTKPGEATEKNTEPTEETAYEFFPIAYLFSNLQVEKAEKGGGNAN